MVLNRFPELVGWDICMDGKRERGGGMNGKRGGEGLNGKRV